MKSIPRLEHGRFTASKSKPAEPAAGHGTTARIVGRNIVLKAGRKTLHERAISAPPKEPWGAPCRQALLYGGDRGHLWHLGYEGGQARLALLDAETLEVVATHRPVMRTFGADYRRDAVGPIDAWYELDASTSAEAPAALLAHANCGDSFAYLFVVEADSDGIVDAGGTGLYDAVARRLDARLMAAEFVSAERVLCIDDIGNLGLYEWRSAEQVASFSIMNALRNEAGELAVWPDDAGTDPWLEALSLAGKVGDTLLVNLTLGDSDALVALVALDVETLTPLGLVRPPADGAGELCQIIGGTFVGDHRGEVREWTYEPG